MNFEIDMTKVVKIVVQKNDKSFIEYSIKDGVIVDAEIIEREKTIEEKVQELKSNPDVQKVSKLIELSDKAEVLTKMVNGKYTSITDAIKDSVKNEPITVESAVKIALNKDVEYKLNSTAKESAEIMKMNDKMDEIAKEKREEIAEKIFSKEDAEIDESEREMNIEKAFPQQKDDEETKPSEKTSAIKDARERIKIIKESLNKNKEQDE